MSSDIFIPQQLYFYFCNAFLIKFSTESLYTEIILQPSQSTMCVNWTQLLKALIFKLTWEYILCNTSFSVAYDSKVLLFLGRI